MLSHHARLPPLILIINFISYICSLAFNFHICLKLVLMTRTSKLYKFHLFLTSPFSYIGAFVL